MNCGEEAEIVEYKNNSNITVKFLKSDELVKCRYDHFKNGMVKSNFTPTVYGVGIVGLECNRKTTKSYIKWVDMLFRCYDKKFQDKHPTYIGCTVCNEWLFYPNFKKWYDENYYEVDNQHMHLDKDILVRGNKVYSPKTCMFVPQDINKLFVKCDKSRGYLPIGVSLHVRTGEYRSRCSVFDIKVKKSKAKHLGLYKTSQEAFQSYKKAKENNIKQVADYYKSQIPEKLYEAMYRYEVHIDD